MMKPIVQGTAVQGRPSPQAWRRQEILDRTAPARPMVLHHGTTSQTPRRKAMGIQVNKSCATNICSNARSVPRDTRWCLCVLGSLRAETFPKAVEHGAGLGHFADTRIVHQNTPDMFLMFYDMFLILLIFVLFILIYYDLLILCIRAPNVLTLF